MSSIKQHNKLTNALKKSSYRLAILASILALGAGGATVAVHAASCSGISDCNSKITTLQSKNGGISNKVDELAGRASNYQDAINKLQKQISSVRQVIASNQVEQVKLAQKIADYQQQIDAQRKFLGDDIKNMYVDGTMSSIEMLASSKNLSDYVDKEEGRQVIQQKIQDTLAKIAQLQKQVQTKKDSVDNLIATESNQKAQLAADEAQQSELLNYNQAQQANYNQKLTANNAQIEKLQSARAAAIAAITGSNGQSALGSPIQYKNWWSAYSTCGGGYSYCSAGFDQPVYSSDYGYGLAHECVNFVSDWLSRNGFDGPNSPGNASSWPGYGANVSPSQVRVGDVAYMPLGSAGHVGIVAGINGDGTFHIKQMNWPVPGEYSEMDLYTQNVTFIHFPRK